MALVEAKSIFSPATGYIARGGFDYTCNPYLGCTFGCSYCYAMFLPQNRRPKEDWGRWFDAKRNAVAIAERVAHKIAGQAVYLSSVTDPYQPAERSLFLTRGILEALLPHQPRLVVQTRSPLVLRDIDLLQQFRRLRVNLSIPTDSEDVWRAFEPKSPPMARRWQAASELRAAGISVGICVTPLLPLSNEAAFIRRIVDFRPDILVLQDFHVSRNAFGANTAPIARELLDRMKWDEADFRRVLAQLREYLSEVYEGEAGFFPP